MYLKYNPLQTETKTMIKTIDRCDILETQRECYLYHTCMYMAQTGISFNI